MSLRISGKNIEISDAYRTHVETRMGAAIAKYFDGGFSGRVVLERDGSGYRVDCALHLDSGADLQAEGRGHEIYPTFEQAAERIDKRLRRYKRRLKDHHHDARNGVDAEAANYVVLAATPDEDEEIPADYSPMVIAEETKTLKTLSVSGAVMAMDLANAPVIVFRHAGHGGVNVIYRRHDGNIGWIDPAQAGKGDSVGQ
ncbi:ribosome-associated translation inhibitor RaiA [Kaistia dalseonensis]|uniref:Ribosome hibernation promoting factor n=1 Tax=Kaistia dalseonensis TaxID=410840 RepID=A0ABU0H5I5_9HYPH|nr:ribosome-associated translation inhibitor RaiA [Kaistia dalseonensis]MCX5494992.1 ribosome-associated translation inhibitor RaiA [Kaistia dalseonensis]MDQ0437573.1 ribosomal subunit interface protein [Kaistia dalseonensis]